MAIRVIVWNLIRYGSRQYDSRTENRREVRGRESGECEVHERGRKRDRDTRHRERNIP